MIFQEDFKTVNINQRLCLEISQQSARSAKRQYLEKFFKLRQCQFRG
jgi:hypothetical protein